MKTSDFGSDLLPERFWDKVYPEPNTGCWLWGAGTFKSGGYGQYRSEGAPARAHVLVYRNFKGNVPTGTVVRHVCDVPQCCNPDHLELGTQADNVRDMVTRGRHGNSIKTHCRRDHEFTPENTIRRPNGTRRCLTCKREAGRAYQRARYAERRRQS